MAFWWSILYYYCNVLCSINIIISLWEHHLTWITCKLQFWVEFIFKVFTKDRGTPSTCHKKNINIELKYNPIFNYQFSRNGCTVMQDVNHNMVIKQIWALNNNINITGYFFFWCTYVNHFLELQEGDHRSRGEREVEGSSTFCFQALNCV